MRVTCSVERCRTLLAMSRSEVSLGVKGADLLRPEFGGDGMTIRTRKCHRGAWVGLVLLLGSGTAPAEVCPGSKVKKAQLTQYDSHLVLSQSEINAAIAKHLPWGAPPCPKLLALKEYVVCYDTAQRVPVWAAYELTAAEVITKERRDAFRTDPR